MFFGCYLLRSLSDKRGSKGRTYVGFTTNPKRRLRQHNGDLHAGGAACTRMHRPWKMLLIVHGFRSQVQALQFEWAWQHPKRSRALVAGSSSSPKRPKASGAKLRLQYLEQLLSSREWSALPLNVTFLDDNEELLGDVMKIPDHILVDVASIESVVAEAPIDDCPVDECFVCLEPIDIQGAKVWICTKCTQGAHLTCMALRETVSKGVLVPQEAACASCGSKYDWRTVLRSIV